MKKTLEILEDIDNKLNENISLGPPFKSHKDFIKDIGSQGKTLLVAMKNHDKIVKKTEGRGAEPSGSDFNEMAKTDQITKKIAISLLKDLKAFIQRVEILAKK